jgi:sugar O-acyltransferase (sialic acid O-acetyltransferase NeuD family)
MGQLVVFGAGAFAEIAHYYFTRDGDRSVAAFTVDGAFLNEPTFQGRPVVPFEEVDRAFPPDRYEMFVALGIRQVNRIRAAKVAEAEARGYRLPGFVSSSAVVPDGFRVRPNTMIMEQAKVHPFVEVGKDTVIWSESRIAFHTRIGDHCWITTATFGESVSVGDYTFVGLNATIAPFVSIGIGNIIGAGALIVGDTRDHEVYRGHASVPSRVPSYRLRGFGR